MTTPAAFLDFAYRTALAAGEVTARKAGRRTIIEADELRRWIATWPVATFGGKKAA